MAIVGAAEVPVRPTFPGFQKDTAKQVAGMGAAFEGTQGRSLGQRLMSGIGRGLRIGALAVGTATAGILTTALVKGWQRLAAIENAEAKLRGLGHSAKSVETIMDNALNSVLGTAFGMDEAATVAASAVAAGIKPGQELEDVLRLTADAATIAGTGMDEMGAIFNKVASSNKIQGDVIAQLHDRGIPIIQMLAKEMGTSVDETYKLASAGEINFETFRRAMEDGVGGAAQNAGETTSGAFANMMAALSRFGAQLLTGIFPLAKHVFGGITTFLDDLTMVVEPVVTSFSERLTGGLQAFASAWNGTTQDVKGSGFLSFMQGFGTTARGVFDSIVGWVQRFREGWKQSADEVQGSGISGFFERFSLAAGGAGDAAGGASGILDSLGSIFSTIVGILPGLISGGLDLVAKTLGWIAENMHIVGPLVTAMAVGFVAWKVAAAGLRVAMMRVQAAQVAMTPVMTLNNAMRMAAIRAEQRHAIATGQATAADYRRAGALSVKSKATGVATAAQRGLNAAMRANPIGAIITVITLLVGALIWFFTQTELGQGIWKSVWSSITSVVSSAYETVIQPVIEGIQTAFAAVVAWFQTTALPILQAVWEGISSAVQWAWATVIQPVYGFLVAAFEVVATAIAWTYQNIIKPVWDFFAAGISWLWNTIVQPVFGFIAGAFRVLGSVLSFIWEGVIQPVFQLLGDIITWLWVNIALPYFANVWQNFQNMAGFMVSAWTNHIWPMIQTFASIITWLWVNIAQPYFTSVWESWQRMAGFLVSAWTNVIWPMIQSFGAFVVGLYRDYVSPALGWVSDKWDWLSGAISGFWNNSIKPVLQAFGDFIKNDVVGMVEDGVGMIDSAWRSVANFFRTPINWVINTVWNDGIKAAFDSVAKAVGSDARMGEIPEIPAFAKGGVMDSGLKLVGEEGPELITTGPGWVATADQTKRLLSRSDAPMTPEEAAAANGAPLSGLPIGGWLSDGLSWISDNTPVGAVVDWARGGLADAAELLLKPILDRVSNFVSEFGHMGQLGSGIIDWGVDQVLDWIRGKDEEALAEGVYDGEFTANPGGFNRPAGGPITSWAGPRNFGLGFSNFHWGVDIGAQHGAAVRAAWDGVVKRTGWGPGNLGNIVVLNHGGYDTAYAHLSSLGTSPGATVTGGQRIGSVGATGGPFAPHLHFEKHTPGFYNPDANVNDLFRDDGGLFYPGLNRILNKTGRPEYSFEERDFQEVRSIIRGGSAGGGDTYQQNVHNYGSPYQDGHDFKMHVRKSRRSRRKVGV